MTHHFSAATAASSDGSCDTPSVPLIMFGVMGERQSRRWLRESYRNVMGISTILVVLQEKLSRNNKVDMAHLELLLLWQKLGMLSGYSDGSRCGGRCTC